MMKPAARIATVNLSGRVLHLYRQPGDEGEPARDYFGLSEYQRGPKEPPMFCAHANIAGAILEYSISARVRVNFLCSI